MPIPLSVHAIYLISTYRMFQVPCVSWEMCTQKWNIAISCFESDMVWLKSKYAFSSQLLKRFMNYLLANFSKLSTSHLLLVSLEDY